MAAKRGSCGKALSELKDLALRARIRSRRKDMGLTSGEVAARIGISRPYYTQIENGTRGLSVSMLHRIAKALKTIAGDLI